MVDTLKIDQLGDKDFAYLSKNTYSHIDTFGSVDQSLYSGTISNSRNILLGTNSQSGINTTTENGADIDDDSLTSLLAASDDSDEEGDPKQLTSV